MVDPQADDSMEGTGSASGAWNNLVASATKSATEAVAGVLVKQAQADLSTAPGFASAVSRFVHH